MWVLFVKTDWDVPSRGISGVGAGLPSSSALKCSNLSQNRTLLPPVGRYRTVVSRHKLELAMLKRRNT